MLTKRHLEAKSIWLHLELSEILQIQQEISNDDATRRIFRTLVRTLSDAGSRGVITDYPKLFMLPETAPSSDSIEKPYRWAKQESETQKKRDKNWQPFSDVFVTEFVRRSLWFQANLADSLLQCWSDLRRIVNRQELEGRRSGNPDAIAERNAYIASFPWRDMSGQPISQLPFAVCHRGTGWSEFSTAWPPGGLRGIISAVAALQIMNLGVVAFCTGARASELSDASLTSLGLQDGERFRARTFKLAEEKTGKLRDWPLHPLAARALNIQVELSNICRPSGSKHLWCMINRDGAKLLNLTEPLVKAVEYIGISELAGLSRAHIHRWRHTVAKLVALSVIGAPQVLLDLFGHRDLEMTLRYMLSDPDIGQEAMRVAKETSIALAMEAIEEAIDGEASGPAAATLAQGLEARRLQRGEEKYGAETLREAAEILTFHGKQWEVVRPGILCTKTIGQFGPCTQGRGAPDPGSCRTDCDHRFELARAKKHCEETILALLTERNVAEADGAEMLLANLDGQILANLKRWADIRERIFTSSELARRLWEESLVEA
jgi:integrase